MYLLTLDNSFSIIDFMKRPTIKKKLLKAKIDEQVFWDSKSKAAKEKKTFTQYVEECLQFRLGAPSK